MEKNLVHGEGDHYGKPFRLARHERLFVWKAFELKSDGSRRYDRALLGLPKGNGKTELAAALGCAELGGPVMFDRWLESGHPKGKRRMSPDIPVAAASFEQADLIFGAARTMIRQGPLKPFFDVFDTEILVKGAPGRMYRVAAIAGTNDGARPTFFLADELHEWIGNKERVHLVLSNGRAKRANSWELAISTAGWDPASLLGRLYAHGQRVLAGEAEDASFLFVWHEAKEVADLGDAIALRAAIREANPAADIFLDVEAVAARAQQIPEFEFRRYHLNQWVDAPERWLPTGAWSACEGESEPPADGSDIVLGLDGTFDGKSTGLVGCTVGPKPHLFVVNEWTRAGAGQDDHRIEIAEAEEALRRSCERWNVRRIGMNPNRWRRTLQVLSDEGLPVVPWETQLSSRMVPACAQFYDACVDKQLTQDGDERLAQHVANAIIRIDSRGPRIAKDHKDSERQIDLAIGAVIAHDLALRDLAEGNAWRPVS